MTAAVLDHKHSKIFNSKELSRDSHAGINNSLNPILWSVRAGVDSAKHALMLLEEGDIGKCWNPEYVTPEHADHARKVLKKLVGVFGGTQHSN